MSRCELEEAGSGGRESFCSFLVEEGWDSFGKFEKLKVGLFFIRGLEFL